MQINSINTITPSFQGRDINISRSINKDRLYLYNEVMNIVKENQLPAIISNEGIKISLNKNSEKVTDKLNKAGIKFDKIV